MINSVVIMSLITIILVSLSIFYQKKILKQYIQIIKTNEAEARLFLNITKQNIKLNKTLKNKKILDNYPYTKHSFQLSSDIFNKINIDMNTDFLIQSLKESSERPLTSEDYKKLNQISREFKSLPKHLNELNKMNRALYLDIVKLKHEEYFQKIKFNILKSLIHISRTKKRKERERQKELKKNWWKRYNLIKC